MTSLRKVMPRGSCSCDAQGRDVDKETFFGLTLRVSVMRVHQTCGASRQATRVIRGVGGRWDSGLGASFGIIPAQSDILGWVSRA